MLYEYRAFIFDAPMLMIWPGLAVTLTALVLHLLIEPDADRLAGLRRMATDTGHA
jgi:ABC-type dipeptide/oligopeptide/nickel transport system permease subunit